MQLLIRLKLMIKLVVLQQQMQQSVVILLKLLLIHYQIKLVVLKLE